MRGDQIMQGLELMVRTLGLMLRDLFIFCLCKMQWETLSLLSFFPISLREINLMGHRAQGERIIERTVHRTSEVTRSF